MPLNNPIPAISAAAFSVSAIPWVTSSLAPSTHMRIDFNDTSLASQTYVSKWVTVFNLGNAALNVGFTENGMVNASGRRFTLLPSSSYTMDLRLTCVYVSGTLGQPFSVLAGLTEITSRHMPVLTGSNGYPGVG